MTQLTSTITIFMELNDFIYFCVHKAIILEINFAHPINKLDGSGFLSIPGSRS